MKTFIYGIGIFVIGVVIGSLIPSLGNTKEESSTSLGRLSEGTILETNNQTVFTHTKLGFSLTYPKELSVTEFDEGDGARTLVFQKAGEPYGFQAFIVPYAGTQITPERIRKDIPSGVVEEPVEVVIGSGIRALVFWSESPSIGKSREAWFIHEGYLYEFTTYAELDAMLGEVLSSLTFK